MKDLKNIWESFWYEYIPPDLISYGASKKGKCKFRTNRLIIILIILNIIVFISNML